MTHLIPSRPRRGRPSATLVLGLLLSILGFLPATPAQAAATGSQVTLFDSGGTSSLEAPSVAYDSRNDRALVVWASDYGSSTTMVWGRFVSADGTTTSPAFKIAPLWAAAPPDPRVIYSPLFRRFLVTVGGLPTTAGGTMLPSSGQPQVYGQWIGETGDQLGAPFLISTDTSGSDWAFQPRLALNPNRAGITVTYRVYANMSSNAVLVERGNLVTANGVGPAKVIRTDTSGLYTGSLALNAATNEYVDVNQGGSLVRFSADLARIGTATSPLPGISGTASVTWNPSAREYAVAWIRSNNGDKEVWVQRFSETLGPIGLPAQVTDLSPGGSSDYGVSGSRISIVPSARTGGYVVVWTGDTADATHVQGQYVLWGRDVARDLALTTDSYEISQMGPSPATVGAASLEDGLGYDSSRDRWLAAWIGRTGTTGPGILAARYVEPLRPPTPSPTPTPTVDPAPTSATSAPQVSFVTPTPAGPAVTPQPAPVPAPCPSSRAYSTSKGLRCGAAPASAFTVAPILQHGVAFRLILASVTAGDRFVVRCVGGCKARSRAVNGVAKKSTATISLTSVKVKQGATLEVSVSRTGRVTRYARFKLQKAYPYLPRKQSGCVVDGMTAAC